MSLYISHPDVPPMKIGAYSKRKRKQPELPLFRIEPVTDRIIPTRDLCYADFFVTEPLRRTA